VRRAVEEDDPKRPDMWGPTPCGLECQRGKFKNKTILPSQQNRMLVSETTIHIDKTTSKTILECSIRFVKI